MAGSFHDVRRYERAPIRERGILVLNGVSYGGLITRVGGGGVFFETPLDLPKGEAVLLKFRLACLDEPLVVKGEVRWVSDGANGRPMGMGIAFLDLDARRRAEIVEFVAERGELLTVVDKLLEDRDADLDRMKDILAKVDLDGVGSLDELRSRVKSGMAGFGKPRER